MTLFYTVWGPGFIVAALLTLRLRRLTWERLRPSLLITPLAIWRAIHAGIVGSADREKSWQAAWGLFAGGHSLTTSLAYLIASRNMTIHFLAIFALSLGAEFAVGQVLGAFVMIGLVALGLPWLQLKPLTATGTTVEQRPPSVLSLPVFPSWRTLLFSWKGWRALLGFIGQETWRFTPTLTAGIGLGGIIFAAGLQSWWIIFAGIVGPGTLASDLINSLVSPAISMAMFLSPVGNLPVIHALFKTDGLSYPGIISFCLASSIHPQDVRIYVRTFGRRQGLILVGLLYGTAVLGGLGSTWIYAMFGFRPHLPPLELMKQLLTTFGSLFK
ncbi:permease [Candidatus Methylomirabilis sp.]|uniref:permease n=1 Tax=Candidatus Methylomirabilis sp. TaxID=2032687 RepID=UPI003C755D38